MHDEFDFADATGAEFDVINQVFSRNLFLDQLLHLAQAFEHAEIEIAPIDEGSHRLVVKLLIGRSARDGPRLDPGVALPIAPMLQQIIFERGESTSEWTGIAEGSQPHVDAEDESIYRR